MWLSALLHAPPAPSRHARCRPCNPYPCPRLYPAKPPKATALNVEYNSQPRAGNIVQSGPLRRPAGYSEHGHRPPSKPTQNLPPSPFLRRKDERKPRTPVQRPGSSPAYFFSSAAGFCFWYCGSASRYFSICSVSWGLVRRSAKIVNASTGVKFSFRMSLAGV